MIVADAARITAAAWILTVVIVSAHPLLFGDAFTLSFDNRLWPGIFFYAMRETSLILIAGG